MEREAFEDAQHFHHFLLVRRVAYVPSLLLLSGIHVLDQQGCFLLFHYDLLHKFMISAHFPFLDLQIEHVVREG